MKTNILKPGHYIAKDGKLLPRPTTPPNSRKNYRYIPFNPINRPGPDDYFDQTISRLQKQNIELKKIIRQKQYYLRYGKEEEMMQNSCRNDECTKNKIRISKLQNENRTLKSQLASKNLLVHQKDKQVLELTNENSRLHLNINNFLKELDSLRNSLCLKDEEISAKNQAIRNYCQTIESLVKKDRDEQRTTVSEHYLSTPRIEEEAEEDEDDEFYTVDYHSMNDTSSNFNNRMYLTPDNHSFKSFEDSIFYSNSHDKQYDYDIEYKKTQDDEQNLGHSSSRNFTEKSEDSLDSRELAHSKSHSNLPDLSANLNNWAQWTGNNQSLTLNLINNDLDHLAGSLSFFLQKK